MSENKNGGKVINQPNKLMVRSWRRTHLPYDTIAAILKAGNAYFIGGLKRQTAHSASKILTRRLETKVTAASAMYDNEKGYAFFLGTLEDWVSRTT